jgi:predicted nucleic-acid-binding protein
MRVLLDANAILRYLLDDDAEMAARTRSALSYGAFLLPEVLAEVVYVLSGVYAVPRKELAEKTIPFLSEIQSAQHDVLQRALEHFGATTLDFVDCLLLAYHEICGDSVMTFDKKLNKRLALLRTSRGSMPDLEIDIDTLRNR